MKKLILTLMVVFGLTSCQNLQEDNDDQCEFGIPKRIATYDEFSVDFVSAQTGYNPTGDSTSLDEMKENRTMWWAVYDAHY